MGHCKKCTEERCSKCVSFVKSPEVNSGQSFCAYNYNEDSWSSLGAYADDSGSADFLPDCAVFEELEGS